MADGFGGATTEAGYLALRIGSNTADAILFVAELGEELPFIGPVLNTLKAIRQKVETVRSSPDDLRALKERCTYITACVVVKSRRNDSSEMDVTPLEDCVGAVWKFVERCSRRGKISRVLKASSDKDKITELNARVDRLTGDLGLTGIASMQGKADNMANMLERIDRKQDIMLSNGPKPSVKLAKVPNGTPARKSWHVERHHVTGTVLETLTSDRGSRLVGLVGDSGSGKTTAASEVVRSTEGRKAFVDGMLWLTVNEGAKTRLPSLMLQLARMVYEDIGGSEGRRPTESSDGAAYIKQRVDEGHRSKGMKCLVVADNVWEKEVVSELLETGMWVLLSTRDEELVTGVNGKAVRVDELSKADAKLVLRKAAELSPEVDLPDDAVDLIELCGRVAMDLAFVGRWSTVRGRQDRKAWSGATKKVRAEMSAVGCHPETDSAEVTRTKRRKAILRAGFEDLAIGSDDTRVQRLYLSLAVMPDGYPFTMKDAAVLLCDEGPSSEDEASVGGVVDVLERWSVLRSAGKAYRMHDAHSSFARERLVEWGYVRGPALTRWVKRISSLDTLRSVDPYSLRDLWLAVESVGGERWGKIRPYAKALAKMGELDPLLRETILDVAFFQEAQEDLEGASTTLRRLLLEFRPDHPHVLNAYRSLAGWADRLGTAEEAGEWRKKELEGLPLAFAKTKNQLDGDGADDLNGNTLRFVASEVMKLTPDDRDEAEELLTRWLRLQQTKPGEHELEIATTLFFLSLCVRQAGRLEEAEELLRRCLMISEAKLGPKDGLVTHTLYQLGSCAREAGRLNEAEELLRRCLVTQEAKLGLEGEEVAITLFWLGECVREAGRLEGAEEILRRCLAIQEAKLGPYDVEVAYTLHQLGICAREAARLDEAEEMLRRSRAIKEARLGPNDAQEAKTLHQLGVCVREAGRLAEAEEIWRRCLGIAEANLDPEGAKVPHSSGRHTQQLEWLKKAKGCLERYLLEPVEDLDAVAEKVSQEEMAACLEEACKLAPRFRAGDLLGRGGA